MPNSSSMSRRVTFSAVSAAKAVIVGALLLALVPITPTPLSAQQEKAAPPAAKTETPAPKTYTFVGESLRGYQNVQSNLADAAEKMPEDQYGFKPTPDVKPFGQHVAHIALSQYGLCSRLKGEPNPKKDEKEEATRSKADAVALLKGSASYCEPLVSGLSDASIAEMMPMGQDKVAKGLIPLALISHGDEVYGTMAVYLRLKGIVPPSTEKSQLKKEQEQKKSSQ